MDRDTDNFVHVCVLDKGDYDRSKHMAIRVNLFSEQGRPLMRKNARYTDVVRSSLKGSCYEKCTTLSVQNDLGDTTPVSKKHIDRKIHPGDVVFIMYDNELERTSSQNPFAFILGTFAILGSTMMAYDGLFNDLAWVKSVFYLVSALTQL